jgi:predicted outer membrane protein
MSAMRRLAFAVLLLVAVLAMVSRAPAQDASGTAPSAGQVQALDPRSFIELAASLAMFEIEAGGQALQKVAHPGLLALARDTVRLQSEILEHLRPAAQERALLLPASMSLEHRAVLDGLTPLDGEELVRRYAQAQTQALGQALALYRAASGQDEDPGLRTLAAELLPRLEQQAQAAGAAQEAVAP